MVDNDLYIHGQQYITMVDDDLLVHGHEYMARIDDDLLSQLHGQEYMAWTGIYWTTSNSKWTGVYGKDG